jgi:hypothetical protein
MTTTPTPGVPHAPAVEAREADELKATTAEYVRAIKAEGCCCKSGSVSSHWCREHGVLAIVPAELTWSNPGIRGGEPCMMRTRVPVEEVLNLLEDGASWEFVKETYPSIPVPPAQPGRGDADTAGTETDRGTCEREPHERPQAAGLTPIQLITRPLVLAWGTRHNRDHIREIAEHIDAELRPVHFREAAASLRNYAHRGLHPERFRAFRDAANLLESTARDLTEEMT